MKTIHTSPALGKRVFSGFAALAALFALAACGGGGGGSGPTAGTPPPAPAPAPTTPPAPAPAASVTINSVTPCVMTTTDCEVRVSFDAKNTVNATAYVLNYAGDRGVLNGDGQTLVFNVTGAKPGDVLTVVFEDSTGKQLASDTANTSCVSGALWDAEVNKACRVPSYFDELTFGIWGANSHFYLVTKTAPMQPLINKTRWNLDLTGDFLFTGGFAKVGLDKQCRILVTMFDQGERKARDLYIDPSTRELHERSSQIPDANNDYVFAESFDPAYPDWYTKAFVQGGVFYSTATGGGDPTAYREHLFYKPDGDTEKLIQSWTIKDGNLKMMKTFSCPKL